MPPRLPHAVILLAVFALGAAPLSTAGTAGTCDFRARSRNGCSGADGMSPGAAIPPSPMNGIPLAAIESTETASAPSPATVTPEPRTARALPGSLVRDRD